jgi:hypothetical protein
MDNLTRYYKIAVIALLVLAYGSLVTIFLIENDSFPSIFYLWIIGGLLYSMTIVYATRIKTKNWILMTIILSGTVWIFPPLMFTMIGIPFSILYPLASTLMIVKSKI